MVTIVINVIEDFDGHCISFGARDTIDFGGHCSFGGHLSSRGSHQMAYATTCRSGGGARAGHQSTHWTAFKSLALRLLRRLPFRAQPLGSNPFVDNGRGRVCTGRVIATRADIGGGEGQERTARISSP